MRINYLLMMAAALAMVSCKESLPQRQVEDFTLSVECASPEGDEGEEQTRTLYPGTEGKVTDASIIVFNGGRLVSATYHKPASGISAKSLFYNENLGTDFEDTCNVYIVSNIGDITTSSALMTSGVLDESKFASFVYQYGNSYDQFQSSGYPMAEVFTGYVPSSGTKTLLAKRLATKYTVTFDKGTANATITYGQIKNMARHIRPFGNPYAAPSKGQEYISEDGGDRLSESDIEALNRGESITLYVLENEQGEGFKNTVSNKEDRIQENLTPSSEDRCTYIHVDMKKTTETADYNNAYINYYFGDTMRDCSVHRNMNKTLVLRLPSENPGGRGDKGEPDITGEFIIKDFYSGQVITSGNDIKSQGSKPVIATCKGLTDVKPLALEVITNSNFTYTVTMSSSASEAALTKTVSSNVYNFTTSKAYTELGSASSYYTPVTVTFESADKLVRKEVEIDVYHHYMPMKFEYSTSNSLQLIANNPFGLTFNVISRGYVKGLIDNTLPMVVNFYQNKDVVPSAVNTGIQCDNGELSSAITKLWNDYLSGYSSSSFSKPQFSLKINITPVSTGSGYQTLDLADIPYTLTNEDFHVIKIKKKSGSIDIKVPYSDESGNIIYGSDSKPTYYTEHYPYSDIYYMTTSGADLNLQYYDTRTLKYVKFLPCTHTANPTKESDMIHLYYNVGLKKFIPFSENADGIVPKDGDDQLSPFVNLVINNSSGWKQGTIIYE